METETEEKQLKLFNLLVKKIAHNLGKFEKIYTSLPDIIILELFIYIAKDSTDNNFIIAELSDFDVFARLLRLEGKRDLVLWLFQDVVGKKVSQLLREKNYKTEIVYGNTSLSFCNISHELIGDKLAKEFVKRFDANPIDAKLSHYGLNLGSFLYEVGFYKESSIVLKRTLEHFLDQKDEIRITIFCLQKLILAQSSNFSFEDARVSYSLALEIIKSISPSEHGLNFAGIYYSLSLLSFNESKFNEALEWLMKAILELDENTDPQLVIDILRCGSKYCISKKAFRKAELLATEAVVLAREIYGEKSAAYSDALVSYGFFLLNQDDAVQAVSIYMESMKTRQERFGFYNLTTAITYEDLSYANYVKEYNTGNFAHAETYANKAIDIMSLLLPPNHLHLGSARRVKALILEENAIESAGTPVGKSLLVEAEELHLYSLDLTYEAFGEMNVQTAKHFGNLGRLYQSMKNFSKAEEMHLRAIRIKESILGSYDYEVALSVGHLASLYNYDLMLYQKAESLHLRSIEIGRKLFGEAYSGLEYDYRGLIQIYQNNGDTAKMIEYTNIFESWRQLQNKKLDSQNKNSIPFERKPRSIPQIVDEFLIASERL